MYNSILINIIFCIAFKFSNVYYFAIDFHDLSLGHGLSLGKVFINSKQENEW